LLCALAPLREKYFTQRRKDRSENEIFFFVTLLLQFTKEKGGIHAIYRLFMETFGWYRLTGFLHQNILPAMCRNHCRRAVVFYFKRNFQIEKRVYLFIK